MTKQTSLHVRITCPFCERDINASTIPDDWSTKTSDDLQHAWDMVLRMLRAGNDIGLHGPGGVCPPMASFEKNWEKARELWLAREAHLTGEE